MSDELVIETEALTKRYGDSVLAVDAVTLRVRRGEVYGFVGPNGAGKTTTLRMLLGLVRPSSGRALVLGEPPGSPDGLARIGALVEAPGTRTCPGATTCAFWLAMRTSPTTASRRSWTRSDWRTARVTGRLTTRWA